MDEFIVLLVLLAILTPILGYLCYLVWFDYKKLEAIWFNKAKAYYERNNMHFFASFMGYKAFAYFAKVIFSVAFLGIFTLFLLLLGGFLIG